MLQNFNVKIEDIEKQIKDLMIGLLESNSIIKSAIKTCDKEKFADAKSHIKNVGLKVDSIDNEIVLILALHQPEAKDLRRIISYLKITNEILRASSSTRSFIKGFQDVCEKLDLDTINQFAIPMQNSTVEALDIILQMVDIKDADEMQENYNTVLVCENKTDDLYEMIETKLLKQADKDMEFKNYHMMLASLRRSEKIADRAMSIATLLLYAINGGELQQN